jgi:tetraacyldisaccharide 4'-kinase
MNHSPPVGSKFRQLVSGRARGFRAAALRAGLRLFEFPYTAAVKRRNQRYDAGQNVQRVSVPVISVGNLTLGGTGKTPMVEWLARWFADRGVRVVLVSRGYKAKRGGQNDEAAELAQKLPGVPHLQNPDRVAAARQAITEHGAELILLDDGFQHRRLGRDLDIVLIDAVEPFGFRHVFPRGTLREPISGWARADVLVLARADMITRGERDQIRREVRQYAPNAIWTETAAGARRLLSYSGAEAALSSLLGQPVAAFCGIGNPLGFRHLLSTLGYNVAAFREFPDHHAYKPSDTTSVADWATAARAQAVLCTHKDLVKLPHEQIGGLPLWAVEIGLKFLEGESELARRLEAIAGQAKPDASNARSF